MTSEQQSHALSNNPMHNPMHYLTDYRLVIGCKGDVLWLRWRGYLHWLRHFSVSVRGNNLRWRTLWGGTCKIKALIAANYNSVSSTIYMLYFLPIIELFSAIYMNCKIQYPQMQCVFGWFAGFHEFKKQCNRLGK